MFIYISHELQIRICIYTHTGTFTWPHLPARNYPMSYKGQFVEGRPTKGCSYVYFGFFCFGLYIMHNAHARRAIALHSFIYVLALYVCWLYMYIGFISVLALYVCWLYMCIGFICTLALYVHWLHICIGFISRTNQRSAAVLQYD